MTRLINQATHATTLSKWMAAATIIGAGLFCLNVVSHVRGTAAPIAQFRSTSVVQTIVPASVEGAQVTCPHPDEA
jgi:hypothetical protein